MEVAYVLTSAVARNSPGQGGGGVELHLIFDPVFVPTDLFNVWILSIILGSMAGLFPAWKASRLSPLEALRSNGTADNNSLQSCYVIHVILRCFVCSFVGHSGWSGWQNGIVLKYDLWSAR